MVDTLDPAFAAALRKTLVETANASEVSRPARWRRGWIVGGVSLALLAGAGAATAALMGVPGGEVSTDLGESITQAGVGDGSVYLGEAPEGADAVEYTFEPLTGGSFSLGPGGAHFVYTDDEVAAHAAGGSGQLTLNQVADGYLDIATSTADAAWSITAAYVSNESVPLATNARGETYGTDAYGAEPDLIAAMATNGKTGYIRREDLEAIQGPMPTSPAEALELQEQPEYGTGSIPVYEDDGVTVIGEFHVG